MYSTNVLGTKFLWDITAPKIELKKKNHVNWIINLDVISVHTLKNTNWIGNLLPFEVGYKYAETLRKRFINMWITIINIVYSLYCRWITGTGFLHWCSARWGLSQVSWSSRSQKPWAPRCPTPWLRQKLSGNQDTQAEVAEVKRRWQKNYTKHYSFMLAM